MADNLKTANLKRVSFCTLGCKLNFSETASLARLFKEAGYAEVGFEEEADVVVLNTCSVTAEADKKCRRLIARVHRRMPGAEIVVTGCYAQLAPERLSDLGGVRYVLGAADKFRVLEHMASPTRETKVHAPALNGALSFHPSHAREDRTRAFLKVQDGCDYGCSFCTIPMARGQSRSSSVAEAVSAAQAIARQGTQEIVLTGINLGDYGGVNGKRSGVSLLGLLEVLDKEVSVARFRLSSIEPNLLHDEIIAFMAASRRFVAHVHMPLQSGSDRVLRAMRRRYLRGLYAARVEKIRACMPRACIGVDVIVGFPGEEEADFLETYRFLQRLEVSYLHVFPYSERVRTPAAEMGKAVPGAVRQRRAQMLRALSEKKRRCFYARQLGQTMPVLFENVRKHGFCWGHTENYVQVGVPEEQAHMHQLSDVHLERVNAAGLVEGRLV